MHAFQRAAAALTAICGLAFSGCGQNDWQSPAQAADGGPAGQTGRDNQGRVSVAEQGFSIIPPSGWVQAANKPPAFLVYEMPTSLGFQANFNVISMPDDGTPLEAMPDQMKKLMPKFLNSWRFVEEGFIKINGRQVYYVCSQHVMNGAQLKLLQYLVKSDDQTMLTISFTAPANRFSLVKGIFEKCAHTIVVN